MFYRKYRPTNFSQVNGNTEIKKSLINSVIKGNSSHAFLFSGPRGVGKTTLARILAKSIACEEFSQNKDVCGKCESCQLMERGRYSDLIEIDAASNNGVENIRDLNDKVALAPTHGKLKFYIIDEVHMLSKGAFNALLKTLEEPPKNTYFALATTEPEKVPDTVKSRCQVFNLKRAENKDIVANLQRILKEERRENDVSEKDLLEIARSSKGGYRDAVTMLEQMLVGDLSVADVINTQGIEFTIRFFEQVLSANISNSVALIDEYSQSGSSLENWNKEILFYLRQIILLQNGLDNLSELEQNLLPLAKDQSEKFTRAVLLKSLKAFSESFENIKYAYIPTLPLEIAVLEIVSILSPGETSEVNPPSYPSNDSDTSPLKGESEKQKTKSPKTEEPKDENPKVSNKQSSGDLMNEKVDEGLASLSEEVVSTEVSPVPLESFSWDEFTEKVHQLKPSLSTALNACEYSGFRNGTIVLQANFSFHKERLEMRSTKDFVLDLLYQMLGTKYDLVCELSKGANTDLTDKNIEYVTISENEVPASIPKDSPEDDFAQPVDDPNFVSSKIQEELAGTGDSSQDFGGEFTI